MLELNSQPIGVARPLGYNSSIKILSALFLFAVCIGGDIFLINSIFIFYYSYFTFFSFIFLILLRRTQTFEVSYAVIPLTLFTGICFLSLFWSVRLNNAETVFVSLFTGLLTYILFPNIVNEENDIYLFLRFIVIAASLNALLGISQGTIGGKYFTLYGLAAQGTTYHPNCFSAFLGIVYPIAVLILIEENKDVWLLPVFLIILANFFSMSRGGSLTIFLLSASSLWFLFSKGYRKTGIKILLIILLSVLVYLFVISLREKSSIPLSRLSIHSVMSTSISRLEIWQGTLQIILHHPFLGVGLRSFEDQFQYFNNPYIFRFHSHAHNLFLHLASEVGIIGSLFFLGFSFWVFSSCIKNYKDAASLQLKMLSFFLLLAISGFFFENLGEYLWEPPLFQVLFYFIASLIFSIKRFLNPGREEISFHLTRPYKISISGLLIIFWVCYVGSPLLGNYYLSKAEHFFEKGDERTWSYSSKASFFDPSNPEPYWLLSQAFGDAWLDTKNTALLEKAVNAQKKAISLFPMRADSYLDLAKLLEEAKRLDEAKLYYEKATSINPNTLKYREELALFLERNGEMDKAIALWEGLKVFLEKYDPKGMNLMKAYLHLSAMYKKIGDLSLLKKYLNMVVNFPEDAIKNEPYDSPIRKSFTDSKKIAKEELGNLTGIEHPKFKTD
jgi:O-antigen ligase